MVDTDYDNEYLYTAANTTAREIIKKEYGYESRNLMTPRIISYGKITPGIAYEVSSGTGFNNEPIWGISFAQLMKDGSTIRRSDLSCMIREYNQVWEYIKNLKAKKVLAEVTRWAKEHNKLYEPTTKRDTEILTDG